MNNKLFSDIKSICKTKSQRKAFNQMVKSFATLKATDTTEDKILVPVILKELKKLKDGDSYVYSFDAAYDPNYYMFNKKEIVVLCIKRNSRLMYMIEGDNLTTDNVDEMAKCILTYRNLLLYRR